MSMKKRILSALLALCLTGSLAGTALAAGWQATPETARAAFDKDECGVWELFGVIKDFMSEVGYEFNDCASEIEMYGPDAAYAYVPSRRSK